MRSAAALDNPLPLGPPAGASSRRGVGRLYHLAEADNLSSILEHGLLSTAALLTLTGVADPARSTLLRTHRPDLMRLSPSVLVRDQRPMPPAALARALSGGLEPADWYALLNSFVFLWPDFDRMVRQLQACQGRPQVLLTFDGPALLSALAGHAFVSPINSGNARRKPAPRGPETFIPYRDWEASGWPTGARTRPPAEVLIQGHVPVTAPFLLSIRGAEQVLQDAGQETLSC